MKRSAPTAVNLYTTLAQVTCLVRFRDTDCMAPLDPARADGVSGINLSPSWVINLLSTAVSHVAFAQIIAKGSLFVYLIVRFLSATFLFILNRNNALDEGKRVYTANAKEKTYGPDRETVLTSSNNFLRMPPAVATVWAMVIKQSRILSYPRDRTTVISE